MRLAAALKYEAGIAESEEKDERILWLAEHGYIEPGEMRMIAEQSAAAKERIGTVAEVATDAAGAAFFERIKTGAGVKSVYERRFSWRDRLRDLVGREKSPAPLCDPLTLVVEDARSATGASMARSGDPSPRPVRCQALARLHPARRFRPAVAEA